MSVARIEGLKTGRIKPLSGNNHPFFGRTKEKHPMFGKPLSAEHKKKLSESATGRKASDETRKKLSESRTGENSPMFGRTGKNNPNFGSKRTTESKQKMSELCIEGFKTGKRSNKGENNPMFGRTGENNPLFGRKASEETKQKQKDSWKTGKRTVAKHVGCGITKHREDLDRWFRSNWEANYARILNYQGIKWVFEPQRFDLGECTYLPDFYLPDEDRWIEIKGYVRPEKEEKVAYQLKEFSKTHNLTIIGIKQYKQLEREFKYLIPNWENGKK